MVEIMKTYFLLIYFFAPKAIPEAIKIVTPPSSGMSVPSSSGGASSCENAVNEIIQKKAK